MRLWQAGLYFLVESLVNLRRGWRTSLFAVLTIAISLFVGGAFLLVGGNAGRLVTEWRGEARIIFYLSDLLTEEDEAALRDEVLGGAEVLTAMLVSGEEAETRFREFFPRMVAVLDDSDGFQLPASLEVELIRDPSSDRLDWLDRWRSDPRVESVDDDVEWLGRLDRGLALARVATGVLWLVFASGTMITIASLVRLSAFAYRDEIDVMRLVGATEFLIRGPFYLEGALQGLLGGALAVGALFGAHGLIARQPTFAIGEALVGNFLPASLSLLLVVAGGLAGLAGALLSIPRE